jgi:heat-inducible transcriptional repressor
MRKAREFQFDVRSREILNAAIKTYVATGEPVGSRTLARLSREGISSATIRNIMADLEEAGYFHQPHTSAGRVPTDKGYRFYVDNLIGQFRLSKQDEARIHRGMVDEETYLRPEMLMERVSHLLSLISDNVGVALSPSTSQHTLRQIEFVQLTDGRILVITVSETGFVQDRVVRLDEEIPQDDLDRTARFITEHYRGCSLPEIRASLLERMSEEKALYDRLLKTAILVCDRSFAMDEGTNGVYVDGTLKMIEKQDFADTERMRSLFRMFEEKSRLVKILNECLAERSDGKVCIQIGAENRVSALRDCTIVASPLHIGDRIVGGIGVVGPTRMEYARVISAVDYVAKLFERVLLDGGNVASR